MPHRFAQLACLLLAAIMVAGMGLSAQGYGPTAEQSGADCCCTADRAGDENHAAKELNRDCCPAEPSQSEEGPCSCACAGCNAMARTVNLFSIETLTAPLYASDAERLVPMPDSPPASATLGVDVRPPIA